MRPSLILFMLLLAGLSSAQPFTLPKLPFTYDAYAPNIDAQTMEIHLTKHHQAYVNNLNKAIKGTSFESASLEEILLSLPSEGQEAVRNNAGGHYNHSLFWEILAPKAMQGSCSPSLTNAINMTFGSMDSLKKALFSAASTRFGSGWAWLILKPNLTLCVVSTANQDNPLMRFSIERGIPILGIDVWEHAYYLNYQNRRADYLTAVWELLDWQKVSEKYTQANSNEALFKALGNTKKIKKSRP